MGRQREEDAIQNIIDFHSCELESDEIMLRDSMLKAVLAGILLFVTGPAGAEEVRLKSGIVKSGEIIEKTGQDITLKDGGDMVTIPFSMVAEDQVKALQALPNKSLPIVESSEKMDTAGNRPEKTAEEAKDAGRDTDENSGPGDVKRLPDIIIYAPLSGAKPKAEDKDLPKDIYKVTRNPADLSILRGAQPTITLSQLIDLREMFQNRQYEKLNAALEEYQKIFEADPAKENYILDSYKAFNFESPALEEPLKAWVSACPDKYQPYMALGKFYRAMGWKSRGGKYINETSQKQIEGMEDFFAKAEKNLAKALSIKPDLITAYVLLINMNHSRGNLDAVQRLKDKALELCPYSLDLWETIIWTKQPEWGGSLEEMEEVARSAEAYTYKNPALATLYGDIYIYQAEMFEKQGKYKEAVALLDKALSFGDSQYVFFKKARIYFEKLQDGDAAWENANKSLTLGFPSPLMLAMRARVFFDNGSYDLMETELQIADMVSPGSSRRWKETMSNTLMLQGNELFQRDTKAAIGKYNWSIKFNNNNYEAYHWRGMAYRSLGDPEAAVEDLKKAIAIDPRYFESYRWLDNILAKEGKWDVIISYWNIFIKLEPNNADAYYERAGTYHHMGDQVKSLADLRTACRLGKGVACEMAR